MKTANKIFLPRCTLGDIEGEIINTTLHGFGDASKYVYCAMTFLVCHTTKGVYTRLLSAKTRVAPLKSLTIHKLELMSACILVTLMETVKKALSSQMSIDAIRYWLDSKTALFWIYNQGEWKNFVQHRVNEIRRLTRKEEWGHVAGVENPADIKSRGSSACELKLREGESAWPSKFLGEESVDTAEERRKACVMLTATEGRLRASNVSNIKRFNTLSKLLRVTAYVKRFINNTRCKKEKGSVLALSAEELKEAEETWRILRFLCNCMKVLTK